MGVTPRWQLCQQGACHWGSGRVNPSPTGKGVRLRMPFALASLDRVMDKCVNPHSSFKAWVSRTRTISAASRDPGLETLRD